VAADRAATFAGMVISTVEGALVRAPPAITPRSIPR